MELSLNNPLNSVGSVVDSEILVAEKTNLLIEIKNIKYEMQNAYNNFDYVEDSLMIDYYTYQIKAYEARFEFLIKKAKKLGLTGI
jgi:hypothetical protein